MDGLAAFGKSVSASIATATRDVDLQGVQSSLSSMASATASELTSFGKELSRDATDAGAFVARNANDAGAFVAQTTRDAAAAARNLSPERVAAFFALASASGLFYSLALFLFLPVLPIAPAKFAVCFSIAGACSMGAVGALRGWAAQVTHMMAQERVVVSLAYVGSLLATLYSALAMHSYLLTVFTSLAQLVALLYYQVSYFPMGAQGLRVVAQMGMQVAKPLAYSCGRALGLVKPKSYLPL